MFDFFKQPDAGGDGGIFAKATEFMTAWTSFMNRTGEHQRMIEMRLEAIDNKLQFLLDGFPPAVTPTVLDEHMRSFKDDPRVKQVEDFHAA